MAAEEEPATERPAWSGLLKAVAGFLAPTTVLTGLLLYFGFAYTDSLYSYFGLDPATLGFSTQDYILRSAGALYIPVGLALCLALVGLLGYYGASALGRSSSPLRPYARGGAAGLTAIGLLLFTAGMLGGFSVWPSRALDTPVLLGGGLLLMLYGRLLRCKAERRDYPVAREFGALALAAAMVVLATFWAVNVYAQQHGEDDAAYLADHLWLRPELTVDTTERLYFDHPGVEESALPQSGEGQRFRFRYQRLRLLAQAGGRMFVIPMEWNTRQGAVLVVPLDSGVRVAFRPG